MKRLAAGFALLLALGAAPARAQVEVDINQGQVQPLPIAVPDFRGAGDARAQALGVQIAQVVAADLERSGYFRPLPKAGMPAEPADIAVQPDFGAWRATGAQALVSGQTALDGNGRLRAAFRLWDVAGGQQLDGVELSASPEGWRKVAHRVADAVYKHLTGEDGYFDTRIAFVAESGPRAHRTKKLAIMDQDGANPEFLTSGDEQVLTPRFGSDQELTYMSLRNDSSRIYVYSLDTARHEALVGLQGQPFAPRFSPDGGRVAMSIARGGNTDIFVMNLRNQALTRLTTDPGIDTSPAYSPDGAHIVFNSDRGGSPQLYVMNADGSGARRISFGHGRYTTPVWSPKGDLIAFTRQEGSEFHIGVMAPDGSGERTLTSSPLDEGPTFAPNGRVLMFAREGAGGARLWTVDVSGRILRPAAYAGAATDPAWSPLLK